MDHVFQFDLARKVRGQTRLLIDTEPLVSRRPAQIAIYDQHRPSEMSYAGSDINGRCRFTFSGLAAGNEPGLGLNTCAAFRGHDRCPEHTISLVGRRTAAEAYHIVSARQGVSQVQDLSQAPMRVSIYRRVPIRRGDGREFQLAIEFTPEHTSLFPAESRDYGESGQLQSVTENIGALDAAVEEFEQQSEADAESQTEDEPDHHP